MSTCCRSVVNKQWIILTVSLCLSVAVTAAIVVWMTMPNESRISEVAQSLTESTARLQVSSNTLSESTDKLAGSVGKIIPIVDQVDDNVKELTAKVDKLDLEAALKRLEDKVTQHIQAEPLIITAPVPDKPIVSKDTGSKEIVNKKAPTSLHHVVCVNRVGQVKCLPYTNLMMPEVRRGFARQCVENGEELECGPQAEFY